MRRLTTILMTAPAALPLSGAIPTLTPTANTDPRVQSLRERIEAAEGAEKAALRAEEAAVYDGVRSEKLGEVADQFDAVHSVQRAEAVGSVHRIIPAADLRPYLADAIQRGIEREVTDR